MSIGQGIQSAAKSITGGIQQRKERKASAQEKESKLDTYIKLAQGRVEGIDFDDESKPLVSGQADILANAIDQGVIDPLTGLNLLDKTIERVRTGDLDLRQKELNIEKSERESIESSKPIEESRDIKIFEAKERSKAKISKESKNKEFITNINNISGDINDLFDTFQNIPMEVRGPLAGRTIGALEKFIQDIPEVADYLDTRQFFLSGIARNLGGEKGVLTDRDVKRVEGLFPQISDTAEVAAMKMNRVKRFIGRRIKERGDSQDFKLFEENFNVPDISESDDNLSFNTVEEAEAANLPKGTIVTINGRRAKVS